uniref:Wsv226-like protein n=1 Tax=Sicyonia whispovirus TaxID=2984283 RepID=A0A9C7BNM5_9VIRU|nr:MAG: wsv226-like protein [Sicyonia whispovirus]
MDREDEVNDCTVASTSTALTLEQVVQHSLGELAFDFSDIKIEEEFFDNVKIDEEFFNNPKRWLGTGWDFNPVETLRVFGELQGDYLPEEEEAEAAVETEATFKAEDAETATIESEAETALEAKAETALEAEADLYEQEIRRNVSEFVAGLPHVTGDYAEAERFGAPYLPPGKRRKETYRFWASKDFRAQYLGHLAGNRWIGEFVRGEIDATTCVGMLRSVATAYGCGPIIRIALSCLNTLASGYSNSNNFEVKREDLVASINPPWRATRPLSMHPEALNATNPSKVVSKLLGEKTRCVALDWKDTSRELGFCDSRNVGVLTNLIYAIAVPAYTAEMILSTEGKMEQHVLRKQGMQPPIERVELLKQKSVLCAIHSLTQYFSGPVRDSDVNDDDRTRRGVPSGKHLFAAPLRLPPFDAHPVVNLENHPLFTTDPLSTDGNPLRVLASVSTPAHSAVALKHRSGRRPKKLLGLSKNGIELHVLPALKDTGSRRRKKKVVRSDVMTNRQRDPLLHMATKEPPVFVRNVLAVAGNYGWFALIVGYMSSPDVLFNKTNCDGLFAPDLIRKYRSEQITTTPLRNRRIDTRFEGLELVDAMGHTSGFRIRPASLSDDHCGGDSDDGGLGVIGARDNPFYTKTNRPAWYSDASLEDLFGRVTLEQHVRAFDDRIGVFEDLLEGDDRWLVNLQDKKDVLDRCKLALTFLLEAQTVMLLNVHGLSEQEVRDAIRDLKSATPMLTTLGKEDEDPAARKILATETRRRELCSTAESLIEMVPLHSLVEDRPEGEGHVRKARLSFPAPVRDSPHDLMEDMKKTFLSIDLCQFMLQSCEENKVRFFHGECREAAHEFLREVYRGAARYHVKDAHVRGTRVCLTWHRPFDAPAHRALAGVPRCKMSRLLSCIEKSSGTNPLPTVAVAAGKEVLTLPSLMCLSTRAITPKPVRHTLLELMYGTRAAATISTLTCLSWINWCMEADPKRFYGPVYESVMEIKCPRRPELLGMPPRGTKRKMCQHLEQLSDAQKISCWLKDDIRCHPFRVCFPKFRKAASKIDALRPHSRGESEAESEVGSGSGYPAGTAAKDDVFVFKSIYSNITAPPRQKPLFGEKKSTGRMGFKDIYAVALISLPSTLDQETKDIAADLGIETDISI